MKENKTRSDRHSVKNTKKINKKSISLIGTSLALMPVTGNLLPTAVNATEITQQELSADKTFVDLIGYSASLVANQNDLYASVMIAQALLESSYGESELAAAPNYNLFGIKGSYNGQSVSMSTDEYLNGEWWTVTEAFRSYSSYEESFLDNATILKTTPSSNGGYYYFDVWRSNTSHYTEATAALAGRYATDPYYNQKLNWLIEEYGLTAYDWEETKSDTTQLEESDFNETDQQEFLSGETITVVSGDTLWGISEKCGLSVEQLMTLNGLTAELITVGQTLIIG